MVQRQSFLRDTIDSDFVLLVLLLVVGGWAFVTSYQFPAQDAIFPRVSSLILLLGVGVLLLGKLLPESVVERVRLASNDGLSESSTTFVDEDSVDGVEEDEDKEVQTSSRYRLMVLVSAYLVAGYLIGLLWASPLFVFVYTYLADQRWSVMASLTALAFGIGYLFMVTLNLAIREGVLTEGILNGL